MGRSFDGLTPEGKQGQGMRREAHARLQAARSPASIATPAGLERYPAAKWKCLSAHQYGTGCGIPYHILVWRGGGGKQPSIMLAHTIRSMCPAIRGMSSRRMVTGVLQLDSSCVDGSSTCASASEHTGCTVLDTLCGMYDSTIYCGCTPYCTGPLQRGVPHCPGNRSASRPRTWRCSSRTAQDHTTHHAYRYSTVSASVCMSPSLPPSHGVQLIPGDT